MPFLTLKIGYFLSKKKHRFGTFFRSYHFFLSNHWRFHPLIWSTHPLLAWVGIKKALFSVFLVVNILKFDINCTFFFWDYFQLTKPKTKKKIWGFAPNPTHLRGRRGMWQNLSTFPWAECWVDSKASRVKCTTASPLTPFHLLGCSKTIRSGRSRKPVKACEATA